ncbi:MAG: hypothetical protein U1E76_26480 [Planctomycetota bacterium]
MNIPSLAGALALSITLPALASNLNLSVQSGGVNAITVKPGAAVSYAVVGVLDDAENEGLAMFAFDLKLDAHAIKRADPPATQPMLNFAIPLGINNPHGFGGTPKDGKLLQIGGAQNTIKNTFAPYPSGTVITGVAKPGQPVTLITGKLTAPLVNGVYHLDASALVANVIKKGANGNPFWVVESTGAGTITNLTITVKGARAAQPKLEGVKAEQFASPLPRLVAVGTGQTSSSSTVDSY